LGPFVIGCREQVEGRVLEVVEGSTCGVMGHLVGGEEGGWQSNDGGVGRVIKQAVGEMS
jgi:hypothetical protein